jgi:hypothetical protein
MVAEPAVLPVTTPAVLTLATDGLLLVQMPPAALTDSVVADPAQIRVAPVIAPAVAVLITVIVVVATVIPQLPVTL